MLISRTSRSAASASSADASAPAASGARPPLVLLALLGVFVGAMIYLVASSLTRRDVPTFSPRGARVDAPESAMPAAGAGGGANGGGADGPHIDTVTFDARDPDRWHYFSLARGAALGPPDTAGWELAVRRYHVVVPGMAADLGPVDLARIRSVPDSAFVAPDGRGDAGHPALRRWYRYGMLTHLLESKRHVYVVRLRDGSHVAMEVLSYYCPGPAPGCLTVRYTRPFSLP